MIEPVDVVTITSMWGRGTGYFLVFTAFLLAVVGMVVAVEYAYYFIDRTDKHFRTYNVAYAVMGWLSFENWGGEDLSFGPTIFALLFISLTWPIAVTVLVFYMPLIIIRLFRDVAKLRLHENK